MKLIAVVAIVVATVLIACSSEPARPLTQPASATIPAAQPTATNEAPVKQTTTEAPTPTAVDPTEAPMTTSPAVPTPEPTTAPTNAPQPPTTNTSEPRILAVAVAEIPDDLPAYDRDNWKHWTDADGDCQDARQEVLVAESQTAVSYRTDRRCRVEAGQWLAPYTSTIVTAPSKLDVDHMVPLGNAHSSGAWRWTAPQRELYANHLEDPQHLIAVTASANRSKGARGPEDWRPENQGYWCQYAVDWVTIKYTWELTATAAEFAALEDMLTTCDVPHLLGVVISMEKPDLPSFVGSTPRPTAPPVEGSPAAQYASCEAAQAARET